MNPYFDFVAYAARFSPGSLARAEEINDVFDLVTGGFDDVTTDLALKAPLANPTFTGTATFTGSIDADAATEVLVPSPGAVTDDSLKAATTAWVHDLTGSLSVGLPLQTGKAGRLLKTDGTSADWGYLDHLHVRESTSSGTEGGSCSSLTTHTRTLNTVIENAITGASLASNKVTLPAGTYKVRAEAPGYSCGVHRLTLYNVTGGANILAGPNGFAAIGASQVPATVSGVFTLSVESEVRLDHYTQSAKATDGLGRAISSGGAEVYSEMELWRTA